MYMTRKPTLDQLISRNHNVDQQKLKKAFDYLKELENQGITDDYFSIPVPTSRQFVVGKSKEKVA